MNYRAIGFALLLAILTVVAVPTLFAARMVNEKPDRYAGYSLSLRLVGTALAEKPSDSVAVIESGIGGQQRSYREGDLADGIRIKQILRNRVIVQTSRGEMVITMTRSVFPAAEPSGRVAKSVPIAHGPRPPKSRLHDTRYLDRESVASSLADIDDIIQTANIETVTLYGKPAGVKIYPIESGSIFSNIGLRNGDVIKEVDGVEIVRPEEAIAIFRQLKSGDDVDIKVKGRRTRRIHLVID